MTVRKILVSLSLCTLVALSGCSNSTGAATGSCASDSECSGGTCVDGQCKSSSTPPDASDPNILPPGDGMDASSQTPPKDASANPHDPKNTTRDTDCDGLSDAEEFANVYPGGKKTDPEDPDTDHDGLPDGLELGRTSSPDSACTTFHPDADPMTHTSPVLPDSDGDQIADGLEDANHNGKLDPGESNPDAQDSDGDGLTDGIEDKNHNGKVDPGETNPAVRDTDGDKIPDGIEDKNHSGTVEAGETDPTKADGDGDGCLDGDEDKNWNHVVDTGESDPLKPGDCGTSFARDTDCDGLADKDETGAGTVASNADTDGDGLKDGLELGATMNPDSTNCPNANFTPDLDSASHTNPKLIDTDCDGIKDGDEDKNHNGRVDQGETDPTKRDTDGDGLPDGLELGLCTNLDTTNCKIFRADGDCGATKTDALNADSDGDGISDGAEDANQNGKVDSGELNPGDNSDGVGPAQQACATQNLRKVTFNESSAADLQIAAAPEFTEIVKPTVSGAEKAVMLYDATNKVVGIAVTVPSKTTASDSEADVRTRILGSRGSITNNVAQNFTTWDGFSASAASYDYSASTDLKTLANDILKAFVGTTATNLLAGTAGVSGPYKVSAEYVRRSANHTEVVLALQPASLYSGTKPFRITDLGGGSALAQFGDANAAQCETFVTKPAAKVDFLWIVDNSCSMGGYQTAVANAGSTMVAKLQNAAIDWRMAATTTSYYSSTSGANGFRPFTTDLNTIKGWFTQGNSTTFGTNGEVIEELLASGRSVIKNKLLPASATLDANHLRQGATLVILLLGDADDQSSDSIATYTAFFKNYDGAGSVAQMHGILCPDGQDCGEDQNTPRKAIGVINALSGVLGDINSANTTGGNLGPTIDAILNAAIASASPYTTQKPPIAAAIKLALDPAALPAGSTCTASDVPRDRTNGFDFDGITRRVLFFGDCRPATANLKGAISYKYWIDQTTNPDGNPDPCGACAPPLTCDRVTQKCVCPTDCGATQPGPGYACDTAACRWTCAPDCNGLCKSTQTCNTATCGCVCNQNVTCAPGFKFDASACACVCDTAALGCTGLFQADPSICACVCKPNCGNTCGSQKCDMSSCRCASGPG